MCVLYSNPSHIITTNLNIYIRLCKAHYMVKMIHLKCGRNRLLCLIHKIVYPAFWNAQPNNCCIPHRLPAYNCVIRQQTYEHVTATIVNIKPSIYKHVLSSRKHLIFHRNYFVCFSFSPYRLHLHKCHKFQIDY